MPSQRPSDTRRRIALSDAKKPAAQHADNQDLVDAFWVLADATFKAEPENAGTKGAAYRKAAQAFAACPFTVTDSSVDLKKKKLPNVGKASVEKMAVFRATGSIPKLVAYQAILDEDFEDDGSGGTGSCGGGSGDGDSSGGGGGGGGGDGGGGGGGGSCSGSGSGSGDNAEAGSRKRRKVGTG